MAVQICSGDDSCAGADRFDAETAEANEEKAALKFSRTMTRPMSKMTAFGGGANRSRAGVVK